MFYLTEKRHFQIYFAAQLLLVAALPFSMVLVSISEIILFINWVLEGDFKGRWKVNASGRAVSVLFLFYLVHLCGMIYTHNWEWGLHDLRIKLPMLLFPLVLGTSKPLSKEKLCIVLQVLITALLVHTIWRYIVFFIHFPSIPSMDKVPGFLDHIRISLMLDLSFFSLFYLWKNTKSVVKWIYIPIGIWLLFMILMLQSLTGILILIICGMIMLIRLIIKSRELMLRWFLVVLTLTIFLLSVSYLTNAWNRFYAFDPISPADTAQFTLQGHPYTNNFTSRSVENGHFVWLYLCEDELRQAWNTRSALPYDGKDKDGNDLKYTLIRYMTSMNLKKDAAGVQKLSDLDIQCIEKGIPNKVYQSKYGLYPRIYTMIWELYNTKLDKNPNGRSISQRVEGMKTGWEIFCKHWLFGVGTGDIRDAFDIQYEDNHSIIVKGHRMGAHNQWFTFLITFGVIGFLTIAFSLFYPVWVNRGFKDYLFTVMFLIGMLSFLDEDILEGHFRISFFAFFYMLFLFKKRESEGSGKFGNTLEKKENAGT